MTQPESRPRLEVLAPAGDFEMLRAAVFSGADCVYLGVQGFNARRTAANFDGDALAEAVRFCHARGCGVYAAVNTLVFPGREQAAIDAIRAVAAAGCDAVIVQDLAVAEIARATAPGLPLHGSTQMSVHSLAGVQALAALGFSRVILARELTLAEIAAIAAQSPIELEVFVHGALCFSVSGQCLMSAFLGGRSANRGGCAGPCRLPFRAQACADPFADTEGQWPPAADCHHLSLKDLSILSALPELEKLGVACAKIEGRLRGPEYTAAVVDAALKARDGEAYDAAFLQDVFSRSGFTDGWFTGQNDAAMFGVRTGADTAASKVALPKARALYRRERPRVPVDFKLELMTSGARLTATDDGREALNRLVRPLPPAEKDPAPALRAALAKTGGTPFYAREIAIETVRDAAPASGETPAEGYFMAASDAAVLRRGALEELLAVREVLVPKRFTAATPAEILAQVAAQCPPLPEAGQSSAAPSRPVLRARFASVAQVPPEATAHCAQLVLPLAEAAQVPEAWRPQTWLELPRVLFGRQEAEASAQIEASRALGFAGYETQNIAHWALCAGLPMAAGFGLNLTNPVAVAAARRAGCGLVTLSPELSLGQMRALVAEAAQSATAPTFAALAYGHLPLMLTRACPLKQVTDCAACLGQGHVVDRTGAAFPLDCTGDVRTLYNPVPLWMADRLAELPTGVATLYFTGESRQQAAQVLAAFAAGQPAAGAFTRGLYTRGTEA